MTKKLQLILMILLNIAVIVYTLVNYHNGRTNMSTMVVSVVFLGWLMFTQVRSLVQEFSQK